MTTAGQDCDERRVMCGRVLGAEDTDVKPVDFFLFDVTGGVFEYQITEPLGANSTHSKVRARGW